MSQLLSFDRFGHRKQVTSQKNTSKSSHASVNMHACYERFPSRTMRVLSKVTTQPARTVTWLRELSSSFTPLLRLLQRWDTSSTRYREQVNPSMSSNAHSDQDARVALCVSRNASCTLPSHGGQPSHASKQSSENLFLDSRASS